MLNEIKLKPENEPRCRNMKKHDETFCVSGVRLKIRPHASTQPAWSKPSPTCTPKASYTETWNQKTSYWTAGDTPNWYKHTTYCLLFLYSDIILAHSCLVGNPAVSREKILESLKSKGFVLWRVGIRSRDATEIGPVRFSCVQGEILSWWFESQQKY